MYQLISNTFPLQGLSTFNTDLKDPCPVYDGLYWHIFGSGGTSGAETWDISHHISLDSIDGPWFPCPNIKLDVEGSCVAAPGVIYDGGFHMFIQTSCWETGGTIEYLVSRSGFNWTRVGTVLESIPNSPEAGIYDSHPTIISGHKYLAYSAFTGPGIRPDIFLAKSVTNSWIGPWERMGCILEHSEVEHHNQHDHPDYEWGLEGAQLLDMADGTVLMNAVCFLPNAERGSRQRIFFAVADSVEGPYKSLGEALPFNTPGENGHASAFIQGRELTLLYQARTPETNDRWRYGKAVYRVELIGKGMKFKGGDYIRNVSGETGQVKDICDNPWDDSLHYSIKWRDFNFTIGYDPEQIDPFYELVENYKG